MSHFGPIPGVPVGFSAAKRLQFSENGVHRPLVGGIHGDGKTGCKSIVIGGGYPEDEDHGNEIVYTGSGGRELKDKNRRTNSQTADQKLEKGVSFFLSVCLN